mmetsp:Transcript_158216/g.507501  ORF Transcript_158216/g.507501 Transcript_158216/m.507501 type:complete len:242 (-) Transcript_158216:437-1162(-)
MSRTPATVRTTSRCAAPPANPTASRTRKAKSTTSAWSPGSATKVWCPYKILLPSTPFAAAHMSSTRCLPCSDTVLTTNSSPFKYSWTTTSSFFWLKTLEEPMLEATAEVSSSPLRQKNTPSLPLLSTGFTMTGYSSPAPAISSHTSSGEAARTCLAPPTPALANASCIEALSSRHLEVDGLFASKGTLSAAARPSVNGIKSSKLSGMAANNSTSAHSTSFATAAMVRSSVNTGSSIKSTHR